MIYQTILAASLCALGASVRTNLSSSPKETIKELWEQFKAEHHREYHTMDEESHRYSVFVNTLRLIDVRNADEEMRNGAAVHGITRFADLTQEEFAATYLSRSVVSNIRGLNTTKLEVAPLNGATGSVDYTGKQTTAIKDQGNCGRFGHCFCSVLIL